MTTLTIELDDAQMEKLRAIAQEWQASERDVLATALEILVERGAPPAPTADEEAAFQAGVEAIARGELIDHAEVVAELNRKYGA